MASPDARKPGPGSFFYDKMGVDPLAPGSADELKMIVELNYQQYERGGDPYNALFAFDALWKIVGATASAETNEPSNHALIPIPWWVVRAIAQGWGKYRKEATLGQGTSLEVAMRVNVDGGRGKAIARFDRENRDHMLAFDVEALERDGVKRTAAISMVADRYALGVDAVRKIHRKHGPAAREKLRGRP